MALTSPLQTFKVDSIAHVSVDGRRVTVSTGKQQLTFEVRVERGG